MFPWLLIYFVGAIVSIYEKKVQALFVSKFNSSYLFFVQVISLMILSVMSFTIPVESWPNLYSIPVVILTSIFIAFHSPNMNFYPLVLIGNWSYSIYLFHWPVIHIVDHFNLSSKILHYLLIVVFTLLLSLISFYVIEKHQVCVLTLSFVKMYSNTEIIFLIFF